MEEEKIMEVRVTYEFLLPKEILEILKEKEKKGEKLSEVL
jgi:hypothetical protein